MSVRVNRRGVVDCRATLDIPLSATSIWGQLRDFRRYARHDFFHAEMTLDGGIPRAGAALTLCHRYAGFRVDRVGRILIWREGVGYSFSDLSTRGPRAGFPHVLSYRLQPAGQSSCRLHIRVRGLWTARHVPRWAAWLWLTWVFGHIVRNVRNELMIFQIWRRQRGLPRACSGVSDTQTDSGSSPAQ
ncbi:MAG TPA: hypothetical protein VFC78_11950 [Tepidisphaeraceae bacterium]|nr:hypothetical protein [Tepidisphaeraceae bacterium]